MCKPGKFTSSVAASNAMCAVLSGHTKKSQPRVGGVREDPNVFHSTFPLQASSGERLRERELHESAFAPDLKLEPADIGQTHHVMPLERIEDAIG